MTLSPHLSPSHPTSKPALLRRFTVGFALLAGSVALAQTPPPPPPPPGDAPGNRPAGARQQNQGPFARLLEGYRNVLAQLDLAPDQRQAIAGILQQHMAELRELGPELQSASPEQRQARIADFMQTLNGKISEQLTPEQKTRFDEALLSLRNELRNPAANPSTRPAQRPNRQPPPPPAAGSLPPGPAGRILQQFRTAIESLDLTEEQKTRVAAAFDDARNRLAAIEPGDPSAREQQRQITDALREQLANVLTPEQQTALRQRMQQAQQQGNRPNRSAPPVFPPASPPPPPPPPAAPPMMGDAPPMMGDAPRPPAEAPQAIPGEPGADAPSGDAKPALAVGSPLPAVSLKKLDGKPLTFSSFKDRHVLLVFGSYSAPTFREKARFLSELQSDYPGRLEIIVVYTAEAFPVGSGDIERNLDDKVRIEQHRDEADRLAAAKLARDVLEIKQTVAIDDLDNTTARALLSQPAPPNAAVLVDRNGIILLSQRWFEPFAVRRALDAALKPAGR